jgi:hypothetical protein
MTMSKDEPWAVLSRVDVSSKIETKNGLSYLSWAWAWGVLREHYPGAWFRKHEASNGYPYFIDVQGYAFVKVTVGLDRTGDYEVTEMLPVLDHRNKPIQGPNSFEVNNALQRCLAKAIAYHGLGHYIYAGEDLPMEAPPAEAQSKPVESASASRAPSPTPAANTAPAAAPAAPSGPSSTTVPLVALDGSIDGHPQETVAAVFMSFIPACKDDKALTKFYTENKTAVAFLAASKPDLHQQVMDAFKERRAELKKTQTKPEGEK